VLFGSHPEFGSSLAMDDVTDTAKLLLNAVEWQLAETGDVVRPHRPVWMDAPVSDDVRAADLAALPILVQRITDGCAALAERTEGAPWLAADAAMSVFGRSPVDIWTAALHRIPELAAEAAAGAPALAPELLSFRPPENWLVDGGFHGVAPLLEQAADMILTARSTWLHDWPGPAEDAYDHLRDSPYHLVAGSYLAALGRVASAALLVR
jgi:hypothetical protein